MPESDLRQLRVEKLLAQDPDINDTQLNEFRRQLNESIELLEQKSKRTRRRILTALAIYLAAMVICSLFVVLWQDAAPNATAGIVRGLVHFSFAISGLVAAIVGIWLVALYAFKYAPQLNRARFDAQTSMMLKPHQQLHENLERQKNS